ncbi:MAG: hypothetical protein FJ291_08655 [Planctomycetes bacterium]|nr:hypothetical protein [Planctomycetota bacterium]
MEGNEGTPSRGAGGLVGRDRQVCRRGGKLHMAPKLPTIVDNRKENTALAVLKSLLPETRQLDIATGVFDLGSLMALDGFWQKADLLRIIMGDETTRRTRQVLLDSLVKAANDSIEAQKQEDDALTGLAAIRDALRPEVARILCRIYTKAKFHAKAYLLRTRGLPVNFGLVGSSNLTRAGLTENLELNLLSTEQHQLQALQDWYDGIWAEAEDVREELLRVIERHLAERPPFIVYAKALYDFLTSREKCQETWEREDSEVYPLLSQYQKDGYHTALKMAEDWGGALICDGVGLGKTYIGLMLIESLIRYRKRVLLVVPLSARESVWVARIDRHLRPRYRAPLQDYLHVVNHTDFGREGTIPPERLEYYTELCDAILIDEAHHFRTPHANRALKMRRLCKGKRMFMMTATPVNNSLLDLYHLIDYFAQGRPDHFARIGVNNLRQSFSGPESRFEAAAKRGDWQGLDEISRFLEETPLFKAVLIQRSRKFVMESERLATGCPSFPERQKPRVINYSLKNVYATLYGEIKEAFDRDNPFLSLAIYNTTKYEKAPDPHTAEYQKQVVGLIRTLLLKRLESSFRAFEASVETLLEKMARFLRAYAPEAYGAWETNNRRWWKIAQDHINARLEREEAEEEDDVPEEGDDFDPARHDMERLVQDVREDMRYLTDFLTKIYRRFYAKDREGNEVDPKRDEKLQRLLTTLRDEPAPGEPDLRGEKVVIFTEFVDTARYLSHQLRNVAKLPDVEEIDSKRDVDRERVIKRFAPYYNCTPDEIGEHIANPVTILISTDVLSEGLNLQDASLVINYDLHWNPVRLMQRIGRVDRRLDPAIEEQLARPPALNGKVYFWNFLPPGELEDLLHLFRRVTGKVLRINAALGIEGALLTPDDPDMTLKEFNQRYEGRTPVEERMRLALQEMLAADPQLEAKLQGLPQRLFSGRKQAEGALPLGIFCCYRLPILKQAQAAPEEMPLFDADKPKPETAAGDVVWLYREHATGAVHEGLEDIWRAIRCAPDTPRTVALGPAALKDALYEIEQRKVRPLLNKRHLAGSAKATLLCWMEVC